MKFKIRDTSWCKRRAPTTEKSILQYQVIGFEKIPNHQCLVVVTYSDLTESTLTGRVHVNEIRKLGSKEIQYGCWTIDSHGKGESLLLELIEER